MIRQLRSVLFVPGHKPDWIQKALASEADAIIIDLEDAVPEELKSEARIHAREAIATHQGDKTILVRVNGLDTDHFAADILRVTVEGLTGYLLPMLSSRDDVVAFDAIITAAEIENGVTRGTTRVIPSFETAASVAKAREIISAPRVGGVMAAAAKDADISRSVGFSWTPEGIETLYLRSQILIEARAIGLRMIVLGLWQDIRDLDGLRLFAQANSRLGYTGQVLIHPTHAPVVNEVYGLSAEQTDYYLGLIAAFEKGQKHGHGAVNYNGEHIDLAHAEHARQILRNAGVLAN